jgi:hypothetical protein
LIGLRYWTDIGQKTADTEYSTNVAGALANIAVLPGIKKSLLAYIHCNFYKQQYDSIVANE